MTDDLRPKLRLVKGGAAPAQPPRPSALPPLSPEAVEELAEIAKQAWGPTVSSLRDQVQSANDRAKIAAKEAQIDRYLLEKMHDSHARNVLHGLTAAAVVVACLALIKSK